MALGSTRELHIPWPPSVSHVLLIWSICDWPRCTQQSYGHVIRLQATINLAQVLWNGFSSPYEQAYVIILPPAG